MSRSLDAELLTELASLESAGRARRCPEISAPGRTHTGLSGSPALSFCSNDYLGLAQHPALADAAARAASVWGAGASASRLVSGDLPLHRELEAALAKWIGLPSALVFPSGYQTNLGLLGALANRDDLIASDELNHASLIDGCRLSRATVVRYRHASPAAAAAALATPGPFRRRFLVTESIFSMDGDVAPLHELAAAAAAAEAHLLVDEAHAVGVVGPAGRGVAAALGVVPTAVVGTLGKALGSAGGFVCASEAVRSTLVNRARTFLFTTALAPPAAAAALAALGIATSSGGDDRRSAVHSAAARVRAAARLAPPPFPTAIVPIVLGSDEAALAAGQQLRRRGVFVQPIRPPTVPEGSARLRITLSAAHTSEDVDRLLAALPPHLRA